MHVPHARQRKTGSLQIFTQPCKHKKLKNLQKISKFLSFSSFLTKNRIQGTQGPYKHMHHLQTKTRLIISLSGFVWIFWPLEKLGPAFDLLLPHRAGVRDIYLAKRRQHSIRISPHRRVGKIAVN
jgi:hypothetical protein